MKVGDVLVFIGNNDDKDYYEKGRFTKDKRYVICKIEPEVCWIINNYGVQNYFYLFFVFFVFL